MTLLDMCRQYNKLTKKMLEAAQTNQWDRMLELNQECQPYIKQLQAGALGERNVDSEVRILIGEIIAVYADISTYVKQHRSELQTELSVSSTASKLEKLYGY